MIRLTFDLDLQLFSVVLVALAMFGIAFNSWVASLGDQKEGYVAFLVAIGVTVTLLGAAVVSWQAALFIFFCFIASGVPMIWGDVSRHIRSRREANERKRRELEEK